MSKMEVYIVMASDYDGSEVCRVFTNEADALTYANFLRETKKFEPKWEETYNDDELIEFYREHDIWSELMDRVTGYDDFYVIEREVF